jgi:hypothetical protein
MNAIGSLLAALASATYLLVAYADRAVAPSRKPHILRFIDLLSLGGAAVERLLEEYIAVRRST